MRLPLVILGIILAAGSASAKDPPEPSPTPDPATELSPSQDQQIQRINDLFAKQEEPLRASLKKARAEYKLALSAHPVDDAKVHQKAAELQKAATLIATAEALHRANVLVLLTPAQRNMVDTLEVTGKDPTVKQDRESRDSGH